MLFQYPTDCNCKHTQCRLIRFGYVISTEVLLDIMLHGAQPDTPELFGQMLVLLSVAWGLALWVRLARVIFVVEKKCWEDYEKSSCGTPLNQTSDKSRCESNLARGQPRQLLNVISSDQNRASKGIGLRFQGLDHAAAQHSQLRDYLHSFIHSTSTQSARLVPPQNKVWADATVARFNARFNARFYQALSVWEVTVAYLLCSWTHINCDEKLHRRNSANPSSL